MSALEPPETQIDLSSAWCSWHARPWRKTWPAAGAVVAMVELVLTFAGREEIQREAGFEPGGALADTAELGPLIASHSPLCCYVAQRDPDALAAAYAKAGVQPPRLEG